MRPDEVRALGDIAGDAVAGLTEQIRQLHAGIARRAFDGVGAAAEPSAEAHDRIAGYAYEATRMLGVGLMRVGALAIAAARPADAPSIEESPAGRLAVGALSGVAGDSLHARGNPLAAQMSIRRGPRAVSPDAASLAAAFPDATPKLVVFVHGLCETEDAWRFGSARHPPYGARLRDELGFTPVYVRYNTGRHISENGRELARLLHQLAEAWPVEIDEVAIVGHSMGGLVARSACHYSDTHSWPQTVRHVVTLGTPHRGAPLAKGAAIAAAMASRLPETRGLAGALAARSAGIKDLAHGYLVDEDWVDQDPEAFFTQAGSEIAFLSGAKHYFVCATLSREPDAPAGRLIGDLLVLRSSAWSADRGEWLRFPVEHYHHVGGANHFDLLNHPAIYEQIRRWIAPPRPVGRD